ncbi:aldo/keto reductase [Paenibacillus rhizoplanae]
MMINKASLVLGTAQLGGNYGIANTAVNRSVQQRNGLLQYALSSGIGYLDTAPGYGDSESIIGDCLEHTEPQSRPQIVTKLPSVQRLGLLTEEARRRFVTSSVHASLNRLKCSALDVCLLHDPLDMTYQGGEILRMLQELKQQQWIRRIGVSVYDTEDVTNFFERGGAGQHSNSAECPGPEVASEWSAGAARPEGHRNLRPQCLSARPAADGTGAASGGTEASGAAVVTINQVQQGNRDSG